MQETLSHLPEVKQSQLREITEIIVRSVDPEKVILFGIGKTYLQEKVEELIPEEKRIEITILSENALYYFGQKELQHKLVLIEDLDGAEGVMYRLKELQSKSSSLRP